VTEPNESETTTCSGVVSQADTHFSRFFILGPLAVHGWRDHMSPPCTLVERFWRLWQDGLFVKSVTCVASMSTIVSNPSLSARPLISPICST
jgi:hypothetical protein